MAHTFTNQEIADLLSSVAAAYTIKGLNRFQAIAYENAASGVEHATSDLKDLWQEKKLGEIPGVGEHLEKYLNELFTEGKVKHFQEVMKGIPEAVFPLLKVPGVGPKTAVKLAEAEVDSIEDLKERIESGDLAKKGFSEKILGNILRGIEEFSRRSKRLLLPIAAEIAATVQEYLEKHPAVERVEPLGSMRRKLATIGDIDFAVGTSKPEEVIAYFTKFPGTRSIVEAGEFSSTIHLKNGVNVDILVQPMAHFGSLLQHFTGSKHHNIHLRKYALENGFSLSEQGVKEVKSEKLIEIKDESKVYDLLKMQTPIPEIREDTGEIELAIKHALPHFIDYGEVVGDLHTHTSWSDGLNTIPEMAGEAKRLGRDYLAITDHSYPSMKFRDRIKAIEQYNDSKGGVRVIYGLEVNINADTTLQVPDDILKMHQWNTASIHTAFRQSREEITQRLVKALEHPYIDAISHPTGRLLLEREGIDADWEEVFKTCVKTGKVMEINSFPNRLDLPDNLVREAVKMGVKFVINTDAHQPIHLDLLDFGVAVARRGWVEKDMVMNSLPWSKFQAILRTIK
jgi:DNA polymerase (family 10)